MRAHIDDRQLMSHQNAPAIHFDTLLYILQHTLLSPFFSCGVLLFAHHGQRYSSVAEAELPYVYAYFCLCWILFLFPWSSRVWRNSSWSRHGWKGLLGIHGIDWADQVVVVTGGSQGVGKAIVDILDIKKVTVVVLDIMEPKEGSAEHNDVHFYRCDVSDAKRVGEIAAKIKAEHGPPTMLVNNAGVVVGRNLLELSETDVRRTFDVNALAPFWTIKAFMPDMLKAGTGHIVNLSSIMGNIGCAGMSDYCAAKHAVVGLHDALTGELANRPEKHAVRLTLVQPSHVRTHLFAKIAVFNPLAKFLLPLLEPHEVAQAIVTQLEREESATICLPALVGLSWLYRGMASWLQDFIKWISAADTAMSTFHTPPTNPCTQR